MIVLRELKKIPNSVVILGFFDGIHIGHQKVINTAAEFSRQNNLKSVVITFREHPVCSLKNIPPYYICTREQSYDMIANLGIDYLIELDFNKYFSLPASDYLKNVIINYLSPKAIFTGYNHTFGKDKSGNPNVLYSNQGTFNYKYFEIPEQRINNESISSTNIRNYLKSGDIENANKMIGREFFVEGTVIEGNKIGRTIGFPTANINYPQNIVEIPKGVYGVNIDINGKEYKGIANFGTKPTVSDDNKKILEVNIFDFNSNIYSQKILVKFLKFIRPEKKFSDLEQLKTQISNDIKFFA